MDTIVRRLSFVRVYLDDVVVVFSKNLEAHLIHLQRVLDVINGAGLQLKLSMCSLAQAEIKFPFMVSTRAGVLLTRARSK